MKKVLLSALILLVSFVFVSCSDQGILKSVQEAKKTSSVKVIDWINENYFLGTSGVCSSNDINSVILENNGISKVSVCDSDWYVLYTLGGKLYKGTLEKNGHVKLGEAPVQENVSNLTNSGFWIQDQTVGFKDDPLITMPSKVINAIEYDGNLMVQTSEGISVYYVNDGSLKCEKICEKDTVDFSGSIYGFVKYKYENEDNYYVLTSDNLYCLEDMNKKLIETDLSSVENNSPMFAISDVLVIREGNTFKYTKDFTKFSTCLELLNDIDIAEVVKLPEGKFLIATSENGVFEVECVSGKPEITKQIF